MCPWVFAQIPSEHPCTNASTHKMRIREAARAATRAIHFCDRATTRKTKSCATGQRVDKERRRAATRRTSHGWGEGHRPHQTKCLGSSGYHCRCSPRRLENSAAQTPDITRMHVPENCARPRARAHLVMCPWLAIRADPVGTPLRERLHPQDAPSRQHWRNTVAHVKQRTDTPETARPMMR